MRYTIIPTMLVLVATLALTMPACTTTNGTSRASNTPENYESYQTEINARGSLSKDQVALLFQCNEGRGILALLADEYPQIYYDGDNRFLQITGTIWAEYAELVPTLSMHMGWMHPQFAIHRTIMIPGTTKQDQFEIKFNPNSYGLTITTLNNQAFNYSIAWEPTEMSQWGIIDFRTGTGKADLHP